MADVLNVALVSTESKLYGRPLQGVVEEIESRVNPVDQKIGVVSARVQAIEQRPAPQLSIEGNRLSVTGGNTVTLPAGPAGPGASVTVTKNSDGTATITV